MREELDLLNGNWYVEGFPQRKRKLDEFGKLRNQNYAMFMENSDKYNAKKKSIYGLTTTAVMEEVITSTGRMFFWYCVKCANLVVCCRRIGLRIANQRSR